MTRIAVEARGQGTYRVTVEERGTRTSHDVTVTPDALERYGAGASAEQLLEASFAFLLEREPKESILPRFDLPVIEQYFAEYPKTVREILGRTRSASSST